jgi:hypothetical protein
MYKPPLYKSPPPLYKPIKNRLRKYIGLVGGLRYNGCLCDAVIRSRFKIKISIAQIAWIRSNALYIKYRKPPTISPGLIYFRKRFLMGLYKGGLIYGGGAYTWTTFCVSVIVINKT